MKVNPYFLALGLVALALLVVAFFAWMVGNMQLELRSATSAITTAAVSGAGVTALLWLLAGSVDWALRERRRN